MYETGMNKIKKHIQFIKCLASSLIGGLICGLANLFASSIYNSKDWKIGDTILAVMNDQNHLIFDTTVKTGLYGLLVGLIITAYFAFITIRNKAEFIPFSDISSNFSYFHLPEIKWLFN